MENIKTNDNVKNRKGPPNRKGMYKMLKDRKENAAKKIQKFIPRFSKALMLPPFPPIMS